jgi:predicted AlkP superfamily phosphohydrolase/phosphomutase
VVLVAIAIVHYSFGRRGSRVGVWLFVIAIVASMTLPIAARGPGVAAPVRSRIDTREPPAPDVESGPRVVLLLLDGASLDHIWPRAAEGRLPNFSRLLENGAVIDLATSRPTQPEPVWTSVATGKHPAANGVRSAGRYYALGDQRGIDLLPDHCLSHALVRLGFVRDQPLTSTEWGARPLWTILSDEGVASGIVGWPLTHPAPAVDGFVVSDRLQEALASISEFEQAARPRDALRTVQAIATKGPEATDDPSDGFAAHSPEAAALDRDVFYGHVARALNFERHPRLFALRYSGLDTVGHYYLRYVQPGDRSVSEDERRRFGSIVDRYYTFIDGEVGIALNALRSGDLLLVVSGFGMQPLNPIKKLFARLLRDPDYTGTHERAPDGFMIAFGTAVQAGRPPRGSIADVTPTVLYFFGLPVARDMDGFARSDLFTRDFTAERPVTFIPSYR